MTECRICLEIRRNVRSIFERSDPSNTTTYADMITYVATVKIVRNDEITDQICLACRKKLKDLYDFKLLIQSSNTALNQKYSSHIKRINFNNITEIKLEFDVSQAPKDDKHFIKEFDDEKINLLGLEDSICYSNTTIKKLVSYTTNAEIKQPMSVMDFLNTIKEDPDENYNDHYDMGQHDSDGDEYIPPYTQLKRKYGKQTRRKKKNILLKAEKKGTKTMSTSTTSSTNICIKPIILKDLKVLPTLNKKPKKKYRYLKKESVCPYCGKLTRSIKSHLLVHGEHKFKCDKCDKGYYSKKGLIDHQTMHTGVREFKCDQCVAAFHTAAGLKSHQVNHEAAKTFVCDTCCKSYKRKHQLVRHVKTHNSANKSHKCELCNMSFFSVYGLRHHMRVHTGERPYNCELCSQPYSYKHDFNRHCFKKHGIFLKRRSVYVMNEEVLARERLVMKDLMLKAHGIVKEGEPLNPFEGPQGALAFEQAIRTFRKNPLTLNIQP
ncbi:uncharacterized protein [Choristoneura fumiferana]|uniref:uncharacterized protein n=1 Tax=Choristoneura fumiferana TaxID=7141 RepID=UPI003D15DFB2